MGVGGSLSEERKRGQLSMEWGWKTLVENTHA